MSGNRRLKSQGTQTPRFRTSPSPTPTSPTRGQAASTIMNNGNQAQGGQAQGDPNAAGQNQAGPAQNNPPPAPPPAQALAPVQQIVVAASTVGRFEAFDPEKLSWDSYYERLTQFFIANDVITDQKKRALLITSLSMEQYKLLTNFYAPTSPTTIDFEDLCTRLKQHYVPTKIEIAEVFNFYQRKQQPHEDVKTFLADLRFRAKDCNFGAYLDRALRDAFVIGLRDSRVQAKLFTVPKLTLDMAVTTAQGMESATQHTQQMRRSDSMPNSNSLIYQSASSKGKS